MTKDLWIESLNAGYARGRWKKKTVNKTTKKEEKKKHGTGEKESKKEGEIAFTSWGSTGSRWRAEIGFKRRGSDS